jgi:hypothetical protein
MLIWYVLYNKLVYACVCGGGSRKVQFDLSVRVSTRYRDQYGQK